MARQVGTIRARGENRWELRVSTGWDPAAGRYRQVSRIFRGTEREALKRLAGLVTEVADGDHAGQSGTLTGLLAEWLDHAGPHLSETTVREYRRIVKTRIVPALGTVRLDKLTARDLDRFYSTMIAEGKQPATVRQAHSVIRRALAQGVKWRMVRVNVATSASPPPVRKPDIRPPSPAEIADLIARAAKADPDFGVLLRFAAISGARRGEVCGLRWRDVDLGTGEVTIRRSIVDVAGRLVEKPTKTHAARTVALDAATVLALTGLREALEDRARDAATELVADAFVFTRETDGSRPIRPERITGGFRTLTRQADVRARFHDLRHFVATRMLAGGADVRTVAGRLGHAQPSTTLNVYSHFIPPADRAAADRLGQLLGE